LTNEENIRHVYNVVQSDQQKSIKKIPAEVGISVGSIQTILEEDLNRHLVPIMLTP
jgi:hypothetical protein